jgi:hypothetical protein
VLAVRSDSVASVARLAARAGDRGPEPVPRVAGDVEWHGFEERSVLTPRYGEHRVQSSDPSGDVGRE